MPTIKDIAALAGVSHGTVSNVLNKRGNVSVEKINLVESAAKELGFKLNAQAKQLRQGHSKRVIVIIPRINIKKYNHLIIGINNFLKEDGYEVNVFYSNNLTHYEEELLERAISLNPTAIVVISSFVRNPGIFNQETKFIFVERLIEEMPTNSCSISFDYNEAGRALACKCIEDGNKNVAIFTGLEQYSNNKQFINGVITQLEKNNCLYKVYCADESMAFHTAFQIGCARDKYDGVLTTSLENAEYFNSVYEYNPNRKSPNIYAITSSEVGAQNGIIKYEMNYKLCGKRIAQYILKIENEEEVPVGFLDVLNDGFCYPEKTKLKNSGKGELNILMLASPTSEALRRILPLFEAQSGIGVKLVDLSYEELHKSAADSENSTAYDLIRLDMAWMSKLGEKLFTPLNLDSPEFVNIKNSISSGVPDDYYKVRDKVYALPLDPSVLLLYYRKDLFEDALIKREFYEINKRQLEVPKTFAQYNEVAAFFTKRYNTKSPTNYGATLVFGTAAVAACDFLPRFKSFGGNIFDPDGRIQIDTPIMRKALVNYIETYEYTDQTTNLWWGKSTVSFSEGDTAMNIVFSNHASAMLHGEHSKVVGKTGFAAIPGGNPLLGGGVIGISKNSKRQQECLRFLQWIYSKKVASIITYLGGYITNKHLCDNLDVLELYPWIEDMEKEFSLGWRREKDETHNTFDEFQFEEILGVAVRSSVSGVLSIDEALKEAQNRCDEVFNQIK